MAFKKNRRHLAKKRLMLILSLLKYLKMLSYVIKKLKTNGIFDLKFKIYVRFV